jgi:hypothetical protein
MLTSPPLSKYENRLAEKIGRGSVVILSVDLLAARRGLNKDTAQDKRATEKLRGRHGGILEREVRSSIQHPLNTPFSLYFFNGKSIANPIGY